MSGVRPSVHSILSVAVLLLIFSELGTSCSSPRLNKKVKRPYDRPKYTRRGNCIELIDEIGTCNDLPYNITFFPNVLKYPDMFVAGKELVNFEPLWKTNCNQYIRHFFCSVFFPKCTESGRMVLPCMSLCQTAKVNCEAMLNKHGFLWPEALECHLFPETDTCTSVEEINNRNATKELEISVLSEQGGGMIGGKEKVTGYNGTDMNISGINSTEYNITEIDMSGINGTAIWNTNAVKSNMTARGDSCSCPSETNVENHNKPTTCVKGDYQCRHATARAYIDGNTLCCFHENEISYTSSCDGNGNIATSCSCSYTRPHNVEDVC